MTGRSVISDRTLNPQRPVISSKLPKTEKLDRTRPVVLDRHIQRPVSYPDISVAMSALTGRILLVSGQLEAQRLVT